VEKAIKEKKVGDDDNRR